MLKFFKRSRSSTSARGVTIETEEFLPPYSVIDPVYYYHYPITHISPPPAFDDHPSTAPSEGAFGSPESSATEDARQRRKIRWKKVFVFIGTCSIDLEAPSVKAWNDVLLGQEVGQSY
ncbi:hypothetical protein CVT26_002613 [Gymnopilus dilepis]|uniref:Uncharacterized protein n=1 Tax=Gymnopilus dilepis TaxID=231916 RepID=A0A409VF68_9AGAR|nr:hypothetical protein CVT26_002613 [Gymnopilus dilepis]